MINIFYHIATMNYYEDVVRDQLKLIRTTDLLDNVNKVYVSIVGDKSAEILPILRGGLREKLEVIYVDKNLEVHEHPTINYLRTWSETNDSIVLYLHTKGVSHPEIRDYMEDWRKYMEYFMIEKWRDCNTLMEAGIFDAIGTNYRTVPPHFSGNFWWSCTQHIKKLKRINKDAPRNDAEFWICSIAGDYYQMFDSQWEHYFERYERKNYDNA